MTIARREFLHSVAGMSLAGSLGGWRTAAAEATSTAPEQAFGFAGDRVPMNAANLCPMPTAISNAVARFAAELDRDLSSANRRRIEIMKEYARAGIAMQLGVAPDEIAIVRNTSEANGIVVRGLDLGPGDEVLLWDQNHPSNALAWDVRAARDGFSVRRFAVPTDAASIDQVVAQVAAEPGPKTRVVSFTHISNVSGFRLPAAELCEALRRRSDGLYIHIDGAQTWGVRDVNLRTLGCDSFSGSAHKWFMGPRETGMLYVGEARQDEVAASVVSVPWGSGVEPAVAGARRFEALGQRDDAALAALYETVVWHGAMTPAAVEARAIAVADRLREALMDLDLPFVSSNHPDFRSNVVILAASREALETLPQELLEESGVITAVPGGGRARRRCARRAPRCCRCAATSSSPRWAP